MAFSTTKTTAPFLRKTWDTTRDVFEPTSMTHKWHWWSKCLICLLAMYQGVAYNAEVWAEMQRHKTVLYTSETLLGDQFDPEDLRSQLVVKTLYYLPQLHYQSLRKVELQHDYSQRRGLANAHTVILNQTIENDPEFLSVFVHELGHVVDLGMLDSDKGQETSFRHTSTTDPSLNFYSVAWQSSTDKKLKDSHRNFVSGYAQTDPYEDFSESYNFYLFHGPEFRRRAGRSLALRNRYNFLKNKVFFGKEFNFSFDWMKYPTSFFDTTKLVYDFDHFTDVIGIDELVGQDEQVRRQRRTRRRGRSVGSRLRQHRLRRRLQDLLGLG